MIPCFKMLETMSIALFFFKCPWIQFDSAEQYLFLAKNQIIAFTYTCILSIFYLVCSGWNFTYFSTSRGTVNMFLFVLGASYLFYCLEFITGNYNVVRQIVLGLLVLLYIILGLVYQINLYGSIRVLKRLISFNMPNDLLSPALMLKLQMLFKLQILIMIFVLLRIGYYGIVLMINEKMTTIYYGMVMQQIDIIIFGGILIIFRPR
jgi:hypothetical protein